MRILEMTISRAPKVKAKNGNKRLNEVDKLLRQDLLTCEYCFFEYTDDIQWPRPECSLERPAVSYQFHLLLECPESTPDEDPHRAIYRNQYIRRIRRKGHYLSQPVWTCTVIRNSEYVCSLVSCDLESEVIIANKQFNRILRRQHCMAGISTES